jgi:hypothetical protein
MFQTLAADQRMKGCNQPHAAALPAQPALPGAVYFAEWGLVVDPEFPPQQWK